MQTRSSLILLAAGLTAALGVTALLVLTREPPARTATGPDSAVLRPGRDDRERAAAEDQRRSSDDAVAAHAEPLGAVSPAPGVAPEAGELVLVQVVRADTREPVPDAQVWQWSVPPALGGDGPAAWIHRGEMEQHAREATAVRADGQGQVQVPAVAGGFTIAAASGELWGLAEFSADATQPKVVALAADREVRVRVTDARGTPVHGAPVVLRQRRGPAGFDLLSARTAAPGGVAQLLHAGHLMRAAPGETFVVALQGLLDPPLEQLLDPAASPDDILTLVLEPNGSCEIVVVDQSGQRVPGPLEAMLSFADTAELAARGGLGGPARQGAPGELLRSRNGEDVVFEHVELGRALTVTVRREGSPEPLTASGPGPRKPGERAVLTVPVGSSLTILRGRLVDAAGAPLGNLTVRARVELGAPARAPEEAWSLRTAADGSFAVDGARWPEAGGAAVLAVARLSGEGAEVAVARRPLPATLAPGTHDLGDFVLVGAPVAIAGIVVDGEGQPVADATVTPSQVDSGRADAEGELPPELALVPVHSDERGRFEILGDLGSEGVALVVRKGSRAGGPVIARAGELELTLVLGATGGIAGTVLLDPSLQDSMVLVQVAPDVTDPGTGADEAPPCVLGADGRFSLRDLRPGRFRVVIVYAANGAELGRVDGLLVRVGETTRDGRLDPLDLRAAGRLIELELVDEDGRPVFSGRAFSRPSDEPQASWTCAGLNGGRLVLLSAGPPLDVAISAAGFLGTELGGLTASQRVVLRRTATLQLYLARGLRLPEPPLRLGVVLTPVEAGRFGEFSDAAVHCFDETGLLTCQVACTGALRVELGVQSGEGPASPPLLLQEEAPRIITVADHAFPQSFEIRFDPAALAAAEAELRAEQ